MDKPSREAPFDLLSPDLVAECVEEAYDLRLEGLMFPYPSYVNRVFGLRTENGDDFVVKFYRPGRWTETAILEEHRFLAQLAESDCPVVAPLPDQDGATLQGLVLEDGAGNDVSFPFALFPKRGGRIFDAESDDDWLRLGALAGRVHTVGRREAAPDRMSMRPGMLLEFSEELLRQGLVHPECSQDFQDVCRAAALILDPLLDGVQTLRIHGDFHRGNILDRGGSLLLIDFDDMIRGPAIQDLWLLLPGHLRECRRELNLILEGYGEFSEFRQQELALIEPLRFLRMVHFLRWQSRQRFDRAFGKTFPDWGGRTFWVKEVEDLRDQLDEMSR